MTARRRPRHALADVRAEIDRSMASLNAGGSFTPQALVTEVNKVLNGRYDPYDHSTEMQVRRDLELRARAGQLVKTGRNERGPDGSRNSRQPVYWLLEAYRAAEEQAAVRERAAQAFRDRLGRVHDNLVALDIMPVSVRGQPPVISVASWEKLLGMPPGGE